MSHASPSVRPRRALCRWLTKELQLLQGAVAHSTIRHQSDRYRKHFTSWQHVCFLLIHGISRSDSLRHTYRTLADLGSLAVQSGLVARSEDAWVPQVSYPQLAASNTSRPAGLVADLIPPLLARARQVGGLPGVPADLHLLDATFLPVSLVRSPWLTAARGVQLQVLYDPATGVPERVVVPADERANDYQGLERVLLEQPALLAALQGQTLVVDRGYYSTVRFTQLLTAGIHLVTRRHPQARIDVLASLPLDQPLGLPGTRIMVHADQRITLGSPTWRVPPLQNWRMVTATVEPTAKARRQGGQPVVYEILTDRWDLPAHLVIGCYLWRWQIELFFRLIKRQLGLIRPLGTSRNAIVLSMWLTMLVHLLHVLAAAVVGHARPSAVVHDLLASALAALRPDALAPT